MTRGSWGRIRPGGYDLGGGGGGGSLKTMIYIVRFALSFYEDILL